MNHVMIATSTPAGRTGSYMSHLQGTGQATASACMTLLLRMRENLALLPPARVCTCMLTLSGFKDRVRASASNQNVARTPSSRSPSRDVCEPRSSLGSGARLRICWSIRSCIQGTLGYILEERNLKVGREEAQQHDAEGVQTALLHAGLQALRLQNMCNLRHAADAGVSVHRSSLRMI